MAGYERPTRGELPENYLGCGRGESQARSGQRGALQRSKARPSKDGAAEGVSPVVAGKSR